MPERCEPVRERLSNPDKPCNCWVDAYKGLYGVEPDIDAAQFNTCSLRASDGANDNDSDTIPTDSDNTNVDQQAVNDNDVDQQDGGSTASALLHIMVPFFVAFVGYVLQFD